MDRFLLEKIPRIGGDAVCFVGELLFRIAKCATMMLLIAAISHLLAAHTASYFHGSWVTQGRMEGVFYFALLAFYMDIPFRK